MIKKTVSLILCAQTLLFANPFESAGKKYNIHPNVLYSIAKVESNINPVAVNKNTNGTTDIGVMQINSIHLDELKKYNITKEMLFNPKVNIEVGAWILAKCIQKYDYTWRAVGCYNGGSNNAKYAQKIFAEVAKLQNN